VPTVGVTRSRLARLCRHPLAVPLVLLTAYLVWQPPVADLAAQVARADVVGMPGTGMWWTGWFGGLTLPSYSLVTPWVMAHLGAPATGAVAALVALVAARELLRTAPRPRLGTAVFGLFDVADIAVGRITFAVGLALGLAALYLLSHPRPPRTLAVVLSAGCAVLCCVASPLAGLFTGLACVAVVVTDSRRRVAAAVAAAALLICSGILAVLFPGSGTMPTTVTDVLPALVVTAGVGVLCRPPVLRVGAVLTAAATVLFLALPGAVGENMTRLAWVVGAPLVIAYGCSPVHGLAWPRSLKAALLAGTTVAAGLAPAVDTVHQLGAAADASATPAFYAALIDQLATQQAAHPGALGQRVEIVDPRTHWSSVFVAGKVPLARGWDRQADAAFNPIFYQPGALNAGSYLAWLNSLAVGWVALPHAPLDYAAVAEGKLVAAGVPGLERTWQDQKWTLYRLTRPTPLASGGRVTDLDPGGVSIDVPQAGAVLLRIRWMPSLIVKNGDSGTLAPTCPVATADGMTTVTLPAGRWQVTSDLVQDTSHRLDLDCGNRRRG
jgi:hypothetical protein